VSGADLQHKVEHRGALPRSGADVARRVGHGTAKVIGIRGGGGETGDVDRASAWCLHANVLLLIG
jgi:hypothetical protein